MSELKPGDRVWIRGFYVEWPTDGTRHISSLDGPETAIPDSPNLAAVARVLAEHKSNLTAAIEMAYVDSIERGDRRELSDALRALAAALNGGAS